MFEGTELDQKNRGIEATRILENPVYQMAEEELRNEYRAQWEAETDSTVRDRLWHEARALGALRGKLEAIRDNGEHSGQRLTGGL